MPHSLIIIPVSAVSPLTGNPTNEILSKRNRSVRTRTKLKQWVVQRFLEGKHKAPNLFYEKNSDFAFFPRPEPLFMANHYAKLGSSQAKSGLPQKQLQSKSLKQETNQIIDWIGDLIPNRIARGKGRIVDFGAGAGWLGLNLRERLGCQVLATDFSHEVLHPLKAYSDAVEVIGLDDFFDNRQQFDFLASHSVFEHLPDPVNTLKSLFDQAEPGGLVFLSVPNFNSFFSKKDFWSHPFYSYPDHLNYFTVKSLSFAMSTAGFEVAKIEAVNPQWVGEYVSRYFLHEETHYELFDILNDGQNGEYLWAVGVKS